MSAENAALLGVYVHSLAADMASQSLGEYGLTPTDIINTLAYALKIFGRLIFEKVKILFRYF
ncbi:MAG: hypothetical protein L6V93_04350 [Clostridiales bacterium]|nr:MAG: hypothetical protein L6V93_04350 [Clostridiales bacterium]